MKKLIFLFVIFFSVLQLSARQGIVYLKNGKLIKGDITKVEDNGYSVEKNKCTVVFDREEIKIIKYTGSETASKTVSTRASTLFVQKMKNTKKTINAGKIDRTKYDYDPLICIYADKYNMDPAFIKAVMETESEFNPRNISNKGAIGLMQLMPETAKGLRVNPKNVEENIKGGTKYLYYMLAQFKNYNLALAGYNAGPGAVQKYGNRIPPYNETLNYVEDVLEKYEKHKSDKQMWYFVDENGCINISDSPKDKRYKRIVQN